MEATTHQALPGELAEVEGEAATRRAPLLAPARTRIAIAILVLLMAAAVAWYIDYDRRGRYVQGTNDAFVQADSVTIAPKVSGYIAKVFVDDNQDVKAGQPLFQVDSYDYEAQVAQYEAQLALAHASADDIRATVGEQEAVIDQAAAQLANAEANARFAAGEVARYEPLAQSGAETNERLAHLRNEARTAQTQLTQQRAALAGAQRRMSALGAQIRQAEARGRAVQAQLRAALRNVESTLIRASIDGRIGDMQARVGQFVQAGTRLTSIVPMEEIYVEANFKETQIGLMRIGQPAIIKVDALPGIRLRGHVASLSPGTGAQFSVLPPQNATGNFTKIVQRVPVRIAFDAGPEARKRLIPGMSVEAEVDTVSARSSLGRIEEKQDARERRGQ